MAKPLYMTTADAARELHCSQCWITKLIRAGRIRATMFGSCWAVLATDLDKVRGLPLGRPPVKTATLTAATKKPLCPGCAREMPDNWNPSNECPACVKGYDGDER